MNCAAIPTELIESELFGHEKGAFTGATSSRRGKFEMADRGTMFLDEVGDLHAASQAKLLRVFQEGEFHRVGGEQLIRVSVRVMAATNRDLGGMVAQQKFREDLYYRLCVVPVRVPACASGARISAFWRNISWTSFARATISSPRAWTVAPSKPSTITLGPAISASCATPWSAWRF